MRATLTALIQTITAIIHGLAVVVDELGPILSKRGLYRREYETSTLREHFPAASPTPPNKAYRPLLHPVAITADMHS